MQFDITKLVAGVHDYISKAVQPLALRIKALEDRQPEKGEKGDVGERGMPGVDGAPGKDGVSIQLGDVLPAIILEIGKKVSEIPVPKDGEPGQPGERGLPGDPGQDGKEGKAGADGKDGRDGKDGERGVDGKSITPADILPDIERMIESRQAVWALDFERRAQELFQRAIDRMPAPKDGKDGSDGVSWDGFRTEHDGRRNFTFITVTGGVETRKEIHIPCVIDAGFWKEGMAAEQGDGVTHAGSYWIAQKDTTSKPETGNPDWRLAVRKGRDARMQARADQ